MGISPIAFHKIWGCLGKSEGLGKGNLSAVILVPRSRWNEPIKAHLRRLAIPSVVRSGRRDRGVVLSGMKNDLAVAVRHWDTDGESGVAITVG